MTQPVMHGYPDFGRYQAQSDKRLFTAQVNPVNGVTTVGVFFVGDVEAIGMFLSADTNNIHYEFNFYETSTLTNLFTGHSIDVNQGLTFEGSLPVLGPWLQVLVTSNPNNGAAGVFLWTTGAKSQQEASNPTSNILLSQAGNLAPGLTNFLLPRVRMGRAILDYLFPAVLSNIVIDSINYLGVVTRVSAVQGNGLQEARRVILPPTTINLSVTNFGGAAAFYSVILNFDPTNGW